MDRIGKRLVAGLFTALMAAAFPFVAGATEESSSAAIFQAMNEEMARSLHELKLDTFGPPYFVNYQIRRLDTVEVAGSFGALLDTKSNQDRSLFVEVRVGDDRFDSSMPNDHKYSLEQTIPVDDDIGVLRRAIWYETDVRYKQAIMNFLKKKGAFISGVEKHEMPDRTAGNATPIVYAGKIEPLAVDMPKWEDMARKVSAVFKKDPALEKSSVKVFGRRVVRYYLDSEGNKIQDATMNYGIVIQASTKTKNGDAISDQETIYAISPGQFPPLAELEQKADGLIAGIKALAQAPKGQPLIGPAIFSPDATAVLFHEAIGHRLEGDRLRTAADGKTFLKKVGEPVLPAFISVYDNPALEDFNGTQMLGHYQYDDEGQPAQPVLLVIRGELNNFLLSRAPVPGGFDKTNGHARGDGVREPIARMSNFLVMSESQVDAARLKERLLGEIKKQNKPYGFIVKKIMGGETQTEDGDFQVFKGKPLYLYKVTPDGREELVRGVDFVGTPLSMIGRILVTGNDYTVINGFCGAESGFIPVTSVAPSILMSEIELQTTAEKSLRAPLLSPPEFTNK